MFFPRRPMPPMQPPRTFGGPPRFPGPGMNQRGGGFLSRLLSGLTGGGRGSNPAQFLQGPMNASQMSRGGLMNPSTLQNLANPANLSSMLGNVQKVLNTAESFMPMVQQYGPLVKNLPGMIKLYKELNNANTNDGSEDEKQESTDQESATKVEVPKQIKKNTTELATKESKPRKSVPKLYI